MCKWWSQQGFPPLPLDALPSTGFVSCVAHEGINLGVYAAFLYIPREGNIGWVEWIVSNPEAPANVKEGAFLELMDYMTELGKEAGLGLLFTSADKSKVKFINRLQSVGFVDGGETVTHLIKVLPKEI